MRPISRLAILSQIFTSAPAQRFSRQLSRTRRTAHEIDISGIKTLPEEFGSCMDMKMDYLHYNDQGEKKCCAAVDVTGKLKILNVWKK